MNPEYAKYVITVIKKGKIYILCAFRQHQHVNFSFVNIRKELKN